MEESGRNLSPQIRIFIISVTTIKAIFEPHDSVVAEFEIVEVEFVEVVADPSGGVTGVVELVGVTAADALPFGSENQMKLPTISAIEPPYRMIV